MNLLDKPKISDELTEISRLSNQLNSVAAGLSAARADLEGVLLRVNAAHRSIDVLQEGIFKHLNNIAKVVR